MDLAVTEKGDGPPLVLVHGHGGSKEDWWYVLPDLARHFRVIAYDHRGHGGSPRAGPFTLDALVDDLAALAGRLGLDRFRLMGHSMGGVVVQRYLASAAAPTVERAVLVDTFFRGGPAPAEEARLTDVERGGMAAIWRPNPTLAALLPDVAEFVEKRFLATSAEAFVALGRELIALPDTRPSLAAIDLPVLVVCGAGDDRFPPAVSRSLAAAIPGCEYAEIPAAGHTPHVENVPAFLAAVLPFLVRR